MSFPLDRDCAVNIIPVTPEQFSRRRFMQLSGGCAALSSTALLSQFLNMQLAQSAVAQTGGTGNDYKALVCVFLLGGIDSYNMLAPYENNEYSDYSIIRTNLAIPKSQLLPISMAGSRNLGLHPALSDLRTLYNSGKAAVVANVGSLVVRTTKATMNSVTLPLGLYSHSDLVKHWQTSVPQTRSITTGWGGRMADLLTSTHNNNSNISMNIALGSLNIFQTGQDVIPYVVNETGATNLDGYQGTWARDKIYTRMMDQMYPQADSAQGQLYSDLLQRSLASTKRLSINASQQFNSAIGTPLNTVFPDTSLGRRLRLVARAIAGRSALNQSRQVFFVTAGGWDHHGNLLTSQADMLPDVSQSLKAFYDATVELQVENQVTTFTASDFARTLSSNGSGSDHGWGGNHFVIGGSVAGGKVYGDYPTSLAPNNPLDLGRGRLIPTTSVDEYNAELAMWFGVPNDQTLTDILPNIRNFHSSGGSAGPLGLFNSTPA